MARILRPTRAKDIRNELDSHPGREYSIDMIHMALHYREPERQSTQQALLLMERQGFIKRSARGRYVSVKAASPVRSVEQVVEKNAREEQIAAFNRSGPGATVRERMEEATVREVTGPALAAELGENGTVEYPKSEPEPRPIDVVMNAIGKLDNVQIIGRNKTGDKWIGIGLSDGTVYLLEEL